MQVIFILAKSQEATHADFKSALIFREEILAKKLGSHDLIFSRFDTKQKRHRIKYRYSCKKGIYSIQLKTTELSCLYTPLNKNIGKYIALHNNRVA